MGDEIALFFHPSHTLAPKKAEACMRAEAKPEISLGCPYRHGLSADVSINRF